MGLISIKRFSRLPLGEIDGRQVRRGAHCTVAAAICPILSYRYHGTGSLTLVRIAVLGWRHKCLFHRSG